MPRFCEFICFMFDQCCVFFEGAWSNASNMFSARYSHTASVLLNGKVLIVGGDNNGYITRIELYDPSLGMY